MDYSNTLSDVQQSTVFHRKSFGLGLWKIESGVNALETFGIGYAKRNRNGVDWGLSYKTHHLNDGVEKRQCGVQT